MRERRSRRSSTRRAQNRWWSDDFGIMSLNNMCERYVGVLCKSLNNNLDESAKQNNNKNFQKGTPCEVID